MKSLKENSFFNKKNAKKFIIGSSAFVLVFSAAALGTSLYRYYNPKVTNKYTSEFIKNQAEVEDFVNNFKYKNKKIISSENFEDSISVYDQKTNQKISDFSDKTVLEFYKEGAFNFKTPSIIKYWTEQKGIDISFEPYNENSGIYAATPNESNSTYPSFYVCFSKGDGQNRFVKYYNFGSNGLYGFKKSTNQIVLESSIEDFAKQVNQLNTTTDDLSNPKTIISLNEDFFQKTAPKINNLKSDSYAKSVKTSDISLNLSSFRAGIKYSIQNVIQDSEDPRKLKVVIEFWIGQRGKERFHNSYYEIIFPLDFEVDLGVDDSQSKVKIFLANTQNTQNFNDSLKLMITDINNEEIEFDPIKEEKTLLEIVKGSEKEKYHFKFEPSASKKNLASSYGLKYYIKPLEPDFIRANYKDPNSFSFKIYLGTKPNSASFYEQSFYTATNLKFKESNNKKIANHLLNTLRKGQNSLNFEINNNTELAKASKISSGLIEQIYNKWAKDKKVADLILNKASQDAPIKLQLSILETAIPDSTLVIDPNQISVKLEKFEVSMSGKINVQILIYYGDINVDAFSFKYKCQIKNNPTTSTKILSDDELVKQINEKIFQTIKNQNTSLVPSLVFNYPNFTSPLANVNELLVEDKHIINLKAHLNPEVFFNYDAGSDPIFTKINNYFGSPKLTLISVDNDKNSLIGRVDPTQTKSPSIVISGLKLRIDCNWGNWIEKNILLTVSTTSAKKLVVTTIDFPENSVKPKPQYS